MSPQSVIIAYDGPALRGGAMDVRDLAPALLAVGQLFDAANSAINGDGTQIRVQVTATEPGSFRIALEIVQSWSESVLQLFSSQSASSAANLLGIVLGTATIATGASTSLLWLVRKLKGRSPDAISRLGPDMIRLTIDGESFDVPLELMRLYQSIAVRDALQRVVEQPLKRDGIDEFQVLGPTRQLVERVTSGEAGYFAKPELPDETLVEETRRAAFSIISLAFKEDNKWRLYDGNTTISASVEDQSFLQQVDQNAPFSKGDILICDVRVTQKRTKDGLKTEYVVERVVEHRVGARQIPLPLESSEVPPAG